MTDSPSSHFNRTMAELRRRWPELAEAANHPLTELFLERDRGRNRRKLVQILVISGAALAIFHLAIQNASWLIHAILGSPSKALLKFFGSLLVLNIPFRRGMWRSGGLIEILGRGDRGKRLELRLAPLSGREISAIEAARSLFRTRYCCRGIIEWQILPLFLGLAGLDLFHHGWGPQSPTVIAVFWLSLMAISLGGAASADWAGPLGGPAALLLAIRWTASRSGLKSAPAVATRTRRGLGRMLFSMPLSVCFFFVSQYGSNSPAFLKLSHQDQLWSFAGLIIAMPAILSMAYALHSIARSSRTISRLLKKVETEYEAYFDALAEQP